MSSLASSRLVFVSLALTALVGCGGRAATTPSYQQELFSTGVSPFAHNFDATVNETCEAARRALLSQGFLTTMGQPDTVDATKNFQPSAETHVVVSLRERRAGRLCAQEERHVRERGLERARLAVAADPLEQRRDGQDFQRDRARRQVL
jgi:hypothetical protein